MPPREIQVATKAGLQEQLAQFEQTYSMTSVEFLRQWEVGLLDDRPAFFTWFGACFLALKMGVLEKSPALDEQSFEENSVPPSA